MTELTAGRLGSQCTYCKIEESNSATALSRPQGPEPNPGGPELFVEMRSSSVWAVHVIRTEPKATSCETLRDGPSLTLVWLVSQS